MMEYVRAEPNRYGVAQESQVRQFEQLLVTLDQAVLSGTIFLSCIEQVGTPPIDPLQTPLTLF